MLDTNGHSAVRERTGDDVTTPDEPSRPANPTTQRLIEDLEVIFRLLRPAIADDWFTVDLTMPQLRALFALRRHGDCRMGIVAGQLGTSLSTATGVIDRLVERGLVERWQDPDDRRSNVCRLTSDGVDLAERLLNLRRRAWEERLNELTSGEADGAQRGLATLLEGLKRLQEADAAEENRSEVPAR